MINIVAVFLMSELAFWLCFFSRREVWFLKAVRGYSQFTDLVWYDIVLRLLNASVHEVSILVVHQYGQAVLQRQVDVGHPEGKVEVQVVELGHGPTLVSPSNQPDVYTNWSW